MALTLSGISVSFADRVVLDNVSIPAIPAGEIAVLLGKNGAGKSTLLKQMTQFIKLQPDMVCLDDKPLSIDDIGYLPQDHRVNACITVLELLVTAQHVKISSLYTKKESLEKAVNLLQKMDLMRLANKLCTELSGGESQMVGMAQAVINDPKVLILDEPTSALDLHNQLHLLNFIREYTQKHSVSTLMVLHDLNLALQYADKVAVLNNGSLHAFGEASKVISSDMIAQVFKVNSQVIEVNNAPYVIPQY